MLLFTSFILILRSSWKFFFLFAAELVFPSLVADIDLENPFLKTKLPFSLTFAWALLINSFLSAKRDGFSFARTKEESLTAFWYSVIRWFLFRPYIFDLVLILSSDSYTSSLWKHKHSLN